VIQFIEAIPKGLRSAVVQAALALYYETGPPLPGNLVCTSSPIRSLDEPTQNKHEGNPFARLKGDF